MIQGYPARTSVVAGQILTLHVATDAPRFRVAFYEHRQEPDDEEG